jgi:AcrR family transcriptional regulator
VATRPSDRAAPGDRKRLALLEAAFDVIAEKGLVGLRTRDVVERAGVNISMLHYYFGTKDGLVVAVVAHTRQQWRGSEGGPPQTLREHFAESADRFRADPRLGVVLQELSLHALRDAATRTAFAALFAEWNRLVADILRHEQRLGLRPPGLDPERAAVAVTAFVMGANMQRGIDPTAFDLAAVTAELDRWLTAAT